MVICSALKKEYRQDGSIFHTRLTCVKKYIRAVTVMLALPIKSVKKYIFVINIIVGYQLMVTSVFR